jgi:hypothetical protein
VEEIFMALGPVIDHNLFLEEVLVDGTIKYVPDNVVLWFIVERYA